MYLVYHNLILSFNSLFANPTWLILAEVFNLYNDIYVNACKQSYT